MKLSFAFSTLVLLLPTLVSALRESDGRSLKEVNFMPRRNHFARRPRSLLNRQNNQQGQAAERQRQDAQVQAQRAAAQAQNQANQAADRQRNGNGNNNGQNNAQQNVNNNNQNKNNNAAASTAAAVTTAAATTAAAASTTAASTSVAAATASVAANNNNNNNNGATATDDNPDTSLTLLAELVATNLAQDGQAEVTDAGQVRSLTSTNNFINFCAGKTITNGQQLADGSCNPIPMGDIISKDNMPSCKFKFPKNFSKIPANQAFTAELLVQNMDTGTFTNAQKTYYAAPQQLNGQGILVAHSHIVIQVMGDFTSPDILDPKTFAFFKGLNDPAQGGVLSAVVDKGLPAGNYRMASINTNGNHSPAVGAVAQHGFFDDMVYFTAE